MIRLTHTFTVIALIAALMVGCSHTGPATPEIDPSNNLTASIDNGPYELWGYWKWHISEDHTSIELTPVREAQFHMNALKFLESGPCYECVKIDSVSLGAEPSTVDVQVSITHPFPFGQLEYTGFDVKGILMFPATYYCVTSTSEGWYPWQGVNPQTPETSTKISWREWGDPEVLNPDGYSYRWSPAYMDAGWGGTQPILQYLPGVFASGEPNAHINAHLNFFTHEDRHMFYPGETVTRTYTIWLPPGEVVAAYAVEACWAEPTDFPVTNPAEDFPVTANQPEPYLFNFVLNNGEIIKNPSPDCCGGQFECATERIYYETWSPWVDRRFNWTAHSFGYVSGVYMWPCGDIQNTYSGIDFWPEIFPDGKHRMLAGMYKATGAGPKEELVFALVDFEIDLE